MLHYVRGCRESVDLRLLTWERFRRSPWALRTWRLRAAWRACPRPRESARDSAPRRREQSFGARGEHVPRPRESVGDAAPRRCEQSSGAPRMGTGLIGT